MYIDQCRLWILIDTVPGVTTVTHKNEYGSQFLCSVGDLGSVVHLDLGCTGRKGWLDMESSWPLAPAVDWESVSSWFWVWYWQSLSLFQGILSPVILEYGCRSLGSVWYWQTLSLSQGFFSSVIPERGCQFCHGFEGVWYWQTQECRDPSLTERQASL